MQGGVVRAGPAERSGTPVSNTDGAVHGAERRGSARSRSRAPSPLARGALRRARPPSRTATSGSRSPTLAAGRARRGARASSRRASAAAIASRSGRRTSPSGSSRRIGLQSAGAVLVPLNTRFKGAEAGYVLRKSRARLLFTVGEFLGTRLRRRRSPARSCPALARDRDAARRRSAGARRPGATSSRGASASRSARPASARRASRPTTSPTPLHLGHDRPARRA